MFPNIKCTAVCYSELFIASWGHLFCRMLGKEMQRRESCNCHMAWFSCDRNAFLAFLYGGQVCIAHCGYNFNFYFPSSSPAVLVVLSTAEVAKEAIKVFQG